MTTLKNISEHHLPLAIGAMFAVLILAGIKELATVDSDSSDYANLYIEYTPCGKPGANLEIYNSQGRALASNGSGVIHNAPGHWVEKGAELRTIVDGEWVSLELTRRGVLEIPGFCD